MKTQHALSIVAGILLASAVTAHADEYQFRHYISGLKPAPASVPEEPTEPEVTWELTSATLPDATVGKVYNYSLSDLVTPASLDGFQWAGSGLPTWASLDWSTGELTGTPSKSDVGEKSFAVTASREGVNGQQIYTIVVGGQTLEVTQIAAGFYHSCAVTTAGAAFCWGHNGTGKLGNGDTSGSQTPVAVLGLSSGVTSVSVSADHSCAVTSNGAAKCWGSNSKGQLGNNGDANSSIPVNVIGLSSGVKSISAGYSSTCALTVSGNVKCWGNNSVGQLGNGSNVASKSPVSVTGLSGVTAISVGISFACALTNSGAVKCWGSNSYEQLGNGSNTDSSNPVSVFGLSGGVAGISAGISHACAVLTNGAAKCWGRNSQAQLGNGGTTNSGTPVFVSGLGSGVASISAGSGHTCAVTTSGAAKCWGYNVFGQLGSGDTTNSDTPVSVSGLSNGVASISAGSGHTCAVTTSGAAKCWGQNGDGRLGIGGSTNSSIPVDVLNN